MAPAVAACAVVVAGLLGCAATPTPPGEPQPRRGDDDGLLAVDGAGGSATWDRGVRALLLKRFDADASGLLDTGTEVAQVPCRTWKALDAAVRAGSHVELATLYGFRPDLAWAGQQLGLGATQRGTVWRRVSACVPMGVERDPMIVAHAIADVPASGGSGTWDRAVRGILVAAYDLDASGAVDSVVELEAIPCATWHTLDSAIRQSWDGPLTFIYGFVEGADFGGDALGMAESSRGDALEAMFDCGLGPN